MCKLQIKHMKENELKSDFNISEYKLFHKYDEVRSTSVNIDISNYGEYDYG